MADNMLKSDSLKHGGVWFSFQVSIFNSKAMTAILGFLAMADIQHSQQHDGLS